MKVYDWKRYWKREGRDWKETEIEVKAYTELRWGNNRHSKNFFEDIGFCLVHKNKVWEQKVLWCESKRTKVEAEDISNG